MHRHLLSVQKLKLLLLDSIRKLGYGDLMHCQALSRQMLFSQRLLMVLLHLCQFTLQHTAKMSSWPGPLRAITHTARYEVDNMRQWYLHASHQLLALPSLQRQQRQSLYRGFQVCFCLFDSMMQLHEVLDV